MQKRILQATLALSLCASMLAGCGTTPPETAPSPATDAKPTAQAEQSSSPQPNPEAAIKAIYTALGDRIGVVTPSEKEVETVVGLAPADVDRAFIRYVETDFGASDVYIVRPMPGEDKKGVSHKDNVTAALKNRKESRIREFANYDVYNSTTISENAAIFERGGYVVMLMLEDNAAARTILEKHIPEKLSIA